MPLTLLQRRNGESPLVIPPGRVAQAGRLHGLWPRGSMHHLLTPDGRYLVVRGRLWRAANPALASGAREEWVSRLMAGRRAVREARQSGDDEALAQARKAVHEAKLALGERGPVWWADGAPDLNRRMVKNSPYARWYERRERPGSDLGTAD